ncbi:hypothetical protein BS47DRAFT_1339437 [Hydnum rufescens UP504]|uniref:Uncharacterized protein n=1 Tax=Hydnum rufescens UP504 TaxID=1448309 RepID=A0A9P6B4J0_9AGAM|nr:hypothetical protein BS47DRAFT_1339437 [Hydnum rufescens UP504]
MSSPGLLFVLFETGDQVSEEEFHEWYGKEHIPLRTENFSAFRTGARYKAIDASKPKFAGVYTVSDSSVFTDPAYIALRASRSPREVDLIKRLAVMDRRIYSLISDTTPMPNALDPTSISASIIVCNSFTPVQSNEQAFHNWYENEYIPTLKQVPGWHRTRRFKLSDVQVVGLEAQVRKPFDPPTFLEVSEFDALSSLHNPKFPSDTAGSEVIGSATLSERRVFKLIKSYEPIAALRSMKTPDVIA